MFCSEEEAKKKIYSVSTSTYTGFGALISEELSCKVKGVNLCLVLSELLLLSVGRGQRTYQCLRFATS